MKHSTRSLIRPRCLALLASLTLLTLGAAPFMAAAQNAAAQVALSSPDQNPDQNFEALSTAASPETAAAIPAGPQAAGDPGPAADSDQAASQQTLPQQQQQGQGESPQQLPPSQPQPPATTIPPETPRILSIMPNFQAVSGGTTPAPPTTLEWLKLATKSSFDYSAFIWVGVTSGLAELADRHPQFGKSWKGYGQYYWHGFADRADGNYWTLFILPSITHEDPRYFAVGKGRFWHRVGYSLKQIIITRDYQGNDTFNFAEVGGRAIAQGISVSYYPHQTAGAIAEKYGLAIGRDALTNVVREFWPDINARLFHHHQQAGAPSNPPVAAARAFPFD